MATFSTIASGSTGNCALLTDEHTHILIDAGISLRRIRGALREMALTPDNLSAVLVTHDHADHISGLPMLIKYYKIPIFASVDTGRRLINKMPLLRPFIRMFEPGTGFELNNCYITSFNTPHDAIGSVGYKIETGDGRSLGFATDLGYMPTKVLEILKEVDLVVIEANHDVDMLKKGPYPYFLKERILGDYGHLSNECSAKACLELVKNGVKTLILAHLSRENNTPQFAEQTVSEYLLNGGVNVGHDVQLGVAPASYCGEEYLL